MAPPPVFVGRHCAPRWRKSRRAWRGKLDLLERDTGGATCWFNAAEVASPFAETAAGYVRNVPGMRTVPCASAAGGGGTADRAADHNGALASES